MVGHRAGQVGVLLLNFIPEFLVEHGLVLSEMVWTDNCLESAEIEDELILGDFVFASSVIDERYFAWNAASCKGGLDFAGNVKLGFREIGSKHVGMV